MKTVHGVAESLLDFQSSIAAEMEASVILGRNLNLQRARELALLGDTSAMMDNILNQLGGEAEWNALNVLQRKSLSKALGMNVIQMQKLVSAQDKSVVQQKSFSNLLGKDALSAKA